MKHLTLKQAGLSLVEIMVALVISVFLLGGIIQVYMGNKATYRFSDASSRIQENGRFALDSITTDVRLAGFFGCVNMTQNSNLVQNHLDTASPNYDPNLHDFINQRPIRITANDGLNNSDSISIKGSRPGQSTLSTTLNMPGAAAIELSGSTAYQNNDIVLITNCWTSDIFEATTASTTAGITTLTHTLASPADTPGNMALNPCPAGGHCLHGTIKSNLENDYEANNASAYVLQNVRYFIQASNSGSGEPALWRSQNGTDEELIEGVERMIVMYGIDTTGDGAPNQYLNSNAVLAAGQTITAVRVFLVVRSARDFVLDASQTYALNGVDRTEADRRLRQVFSVTVDLRNR